MFDKYSSFPQMTSILILETEIYASVTTDMLSTDLGYKSCVSLSRKIVYIFHLD